MAIVELNHYNLRAGAELAERVGDWYRDVLGLAVGERPPFSFPGYWLYAGARPLVHLSVAGEGEERAAALRGAIDHVAFTCTDFEATSARLDAAGVAYRVADVPARRQRQIFLEDPAGNGVELNFEA
jgi:glyoxylase I family protein